MNRSGTARDTGDRGTEAGHVGGGLIPDADLNRSAVQAHTNTPPGSQGTRTADRERACPCLPVRVLLPCHVRLRSTRSPASEARSATWGQRNAGRPGTSGVPSATWRLRDGGHSAESSARTTELRRPQTESGLQRAPRGGSAGGGGWSDAHARPVSCPPCLQGEEHFHSRTHPALRKRTWLTRHARIRTETSISYKGKKGKLRGTTTFPATISTKRGLSEGSSILHCKLSLEFNFTQGEIPAKQNKTFAWRDYDSKLYKGENVDGQTTSLLSEASYQQ